MSKYFNQTTNKTENTRSVRINDKNYIIPISKHERYASRPDSLEHMCFAQFLIWYKPLTNQTKKTKYEELSSHDIICPHQTKPEKMPIVIELKDPSLGCMKNEPACPYRMYLADVCWPPRLQNPKQMQLQRRHPFFLLQKRGRWVILWYCASQSIVFLL